MPAIVYYNEIDKYCCKWLENLMEADLLPYGYIDDRPIQEVKAYDLEPYTQCHFFAGIGGWPLALRMSGWPDDWAVWTGSCPCQPFSVAGKRKGTADERHLWPYFHKLIGECGPPTIFGEQVTSKDGCKWLSGVQTDLESLGYAFGGADLCAAGVGSPHIRQRLYWLANNNNNNNKGLEGREISTECFDQCSIGPSSMVGGLDDTRCQCNESRRGFRNVEQETEDQQSEAPQRQWSGDANRDSSTINYWSDFDIVYCLDGKTRRIEPGTFPLAHGVPARMGKLRAYGNAIVPQVATEFIQAYLATLSQL